VEVESVSVKLLNLDPNNARGHEKGIPELMKSLTAFGQQKPIVVWGENVVIAGNGTLLAARKLKWKEISIVRVPEDWDYEKAKAFALADNRTAELSEWNFVVLSETRFDLDANGWDMEQFGFDPLAAPNFLPSNGEQPRLDQSVLHECPKCKFEWRVNSKGQVVPE
jgi:ParB-like chromosome segregation protein Spo0J